MAKFAVGLPLFLLSLHSKQVFSISRNAQAAAAGTQENGCSCDQKRPRPPVAVPWIELKIGGPSKLVVFLRGSGVVGVVGMMGGWFPFKPAPKTAPAPRPFLTATVHPQLPSRLWVAGPCTPGVLVAVQQVPGVPSPFFPGPKDTQNPGETAGS